MSFGFFRSDATYLACLAASGRNAFRQQFVWRKDVNRTCRLLLWHHDGPFGFIWLHPVGYVMHRSWTTFHIRIMRTLRHDQIKWLEADQNLRAFQKYFAPLTPYWPPGGGINRRQCHDKTWGKRSAMTFFHLHTQETSPTWRYLPISRPCIGHVVYVLISPRACWNMLKRI